MHTKFAVLCGPVVLGVAVLATGGAPDAPLTARPFPAPQQQQQQPPPTPPQQQQGEIELSLTAAGYQPKLGLPDFIIQGGDAKFKEMAATLADTLWSDLDFEKEFWLIDRKSSARIAPAATIAAIDYEAWTTLGADFVALGVVRPTATGF